MLVLHSAWIDFDRAEVRLTLVAVLLMGFGAASWFNSYTFGPWFVFAGFLVLITMMFGLGSAAKTAVDALRLGAADYLVKGFELDELRQRVANLLRLASLEQESHIFLQG